MVSKSLSLNLNVSFLNRISLLFNLVATQLSSRGWVDPVQNPVLPEKFLADNREPNHGPLECQSDVLTTIPNRRPCMPEELKENIRTIISCISEWELVRVNDAFLRCELCNKQYEQHCEQAST